MPQHYKNIEGYFDFESLYQFAVQRYIKSGIFVELGSWLGKSTCYMSELIKENNANIKFYTVDTFLGERNATDQKKIIEECGGSIYFQFLQNMKNADILDFVTPFALTSKKASELFDAQKIDFLFIDCEHHYKDVMEDLEIWFSKISNNGIIAGHDYYEGSEVKLAVDDFFLGKYNIPPQRVGNSFMVGIRYVNEAQEQKQYLGDIVIGKKNE